MCQSQARLSRQFDPQHRHGCCAPVNASSVYLAITQDYLAEDNIDWYIYAWWLVSHEIPMGHRFVN